MPAEIILSNGSALRVHEEPDSVCQKLSHPDESGLVGTFLYIKADGDDFWVNPDQVACVRRI